MPRFVWTSQGIGQALGVPGTGFESRAYEGVSTDTRTLRPGELFVALRGERFDGAEFVGSAVKAGARGAVVERDPGGLRDDCELFLVDDARLALAQLAMARRRALDPTVVAVTGTSGKTTTRDLLAAAVGRGAFASPGNYNNLVGVPLSMLAAPEAAAVWVLELASNQRGEIQRLACVAEPNFGLITSVAEGHLDGLGDLQGVLDEKLGLLSSIRSGGWAVVLDEPAELSARARERCPNVVTVGLTSEADERPEELSLSEEGISWRWRGVDFRLARIGAHMLQNAMLALAMARLLGIEPVDAAERLRTVELSPMRGEVRQLGGLTLLVDCYNANPSSFRAAIEALETLAAGRSRVVVAGTMLELGTQSRALHERVAELLVESGVDLVAATGEFKLVLAARASELGERLMVDDDLEALYRALAARLKGDEVVLLKASRGMKFERLLPLFQRDFDRT